MNLPELIKDRKDIDWLWNRTLFLTAHGSHAYGTSLPTSDRDYKGFAVPPGPYFHGYAKRFEQAEFKGDPDMVVYDIRKFFKLAADCNPSILEILYTDPSDHVILTPLGQTVMENRDLFLSRKAKFTFSGYAVSQLKRIKSHYKWLKNPPKRAPVRADLGLPETTVIPRDQLQAAQAMIRKQVESWTNVPMDELDDAAKIAIMDRFTEALAQVRGATDLDILAGKSLGFSSNFLELLDKERTWNGLVAKWRSYQIWLADRNPARAELEAKWGYDTKHGMHLVRLMRMGKEVMEGKGVTVKRPDAQELLAIRAGAWKYEDLIEWATAQEAELDRLYIVSPLPKSPDINKLDSLLIQVVESGLATLT